MTDVFSYGNCGRGCGLDAVERSSLGRRVELAKTMVLRRCWQRRQWWQWSCRGSSRQQIGG